MNLKNNSLPLIRFLMVLAFSISTLFTPTAIQAQSDFYIQGPEAWSEGYCTIDGVASIQGLQCLLGNFFSVAITLIGLAAFLMLIYGSIRYMLAGSNANAASTARSTITFAIIGIVVSLSAFVIILFIADFTGVRTLLRFSIPDSNDF